MLSYIAITFLMILGCFLMFIILLQRGRGGGLAGAFGGLGGQSAFGTKAGDVFTKITIVIAVLWVATAGLSGFALRAGQSRYSAGSPETLQVGPDEPVEPPVQKTTEPLAGEESGEATKDSGAQPGAGETDGGESPTNNAARDGAQPE